MKTIKLKIEDLGYSGEGIAHYGGKTFFVPFTLVGEEVEAEIQKQKGNVVFAKYTKILKPSKQRQVPPCPYFEKCGGCDLQHMNYESQLLFKKNLVQNTIKKIAGLDANVLSLEPSEKKFEYRNKISLPVKNGQLGLYQKASHDIVEVDKCLITEQFNEKLIEILQNFLSKFKNESITHFVARFLNETLLLTIVSKNKQVQGLEFLEIELKQNFQNFGVNINLNKKENEEILTDRFIHLCGQKQIEMNENGVDVVVSNKSFFQVNDNVRKKIYDYVCSKISGQNIIDAYSGVGVLSCQLATKAKSVVAVEIEKSACQNAQELITRNKIKNIKVICGNCKIEIPKLCRKEKIDAVVLDPPRAGCNVEVLDAIIEGRVPKIVYISCSPQTLARDIKILKEKYEIESIKSFDMFPQTHHVESVAILTLKK